MKKIWLVIFFCFSFLTYADKRQIIELPTDKKSLHEVGVHLYARETGFLTRPWIVFPPTLDAGFKFSGLTLTILDGDEYLYFGNLNVCTLKSPNIIYHHANFMFSTSSSRTYGLYLTYENRQTLEIKELSWEDLKDVSYDLDEPDPLDKIFAGEEPSYTEESYCN